MSCIRGQCFFVTTRSVKRSTKRNGTSRERRSKSVAGTIVQKNAGRSTMTRSGVVKGKKDDTITCGFHRNP